MFRGQARVSSQPLIEPTPHRQPRTTTHIHVLPRFSGEASQTSSASERTTTQTLFQGCRRAPPAYNGWQQHPVAMSLIMHPVNLILISDARHKHHPPSSVHPNMTAMACWDAAPCLMPRDAPSPPKQSQQCPPLRATFVPYQPSSTAPSRPPASTVCHRQQPQPSLLSIQTHKCCHREAGAATHHQPPKQRCAVLVAAAVLPSTKNT